MSQNARVATDTAAELVARALAAARVAEESDDWGGHGELLRLAAADGPGSLTLGLELIDSADLVERETGCDLLFHASDLNEAVRGDVAAALVALARRETQGRVLWALARAIERTYDHRAVPVLVALAEHPDAEIRLQVAASFAGVVTGASDGPDIRTLIALSRDPDPRVRNWATFTLGFQAEVDSGAIRAALWERTGDQDAEVREEGVRGLARRHDPRAVPLLLRLLQDPQGAHVLTFHAAQIMGAPELLAALLEYELDDAWVAEAVNACDPVRSGQLSAFAWDLVCGLDRARPDLDAAVYVERFGSGLTLGFGRDAGAESSGSCVEALSRRADGDAARARELITADLPAFTSD